VSCLRRFRLPGAAQNSTSAQTTRKTRLFPKPAGVSFWRESRLGSKAGWFAAAVATLVAAGLGFGLYHATRPAPLKPLVRLDVDLGPDVSLGSVAGVDQIISPDGTRIVYVSQGRLFTRRLDQPNTTELPGTQGASEPFFSPDGQWVAFFSSKSL